MAVLHIVLALAGLDIGSNAVFALVNAFALMRAWEMADLKQERKLLAFLAGYAVLLVLLVGMARSLLLFVTFAFLYVGAFHVPVLLGYVIILMLSLVFVSPYWLQVAVLLAIPYTIACRIHREASDRFAVGSFAVGFILLAAIVLPIFYLVFQSTPQTLAHTARGVEFRTALANTFWTATVSTILILLFGVPLAYAMARLEFRGKDIIDSLIDLPILIPQSVAGIALMVIFGSKTPVGEFLETHLGVSVSGSFVGIIACQVFVSSPFLIRAALNSFLQMDPKLENVSRTLGASMMGTFRRVSLPLATPAIFSGCILTWSRAVSETGSIMVIAYKPLTIGTLTFDSFTQYGLEEARPVAVLLVLVCLWAFIALRWARGYASVLSARRTRPGTSRPTGDMPPEGPQSSLAGSGSLWP